MERRLFSLFLIVFSGGVIVVGGYNCAQKTIQDTTPQGPVWNPLPPAAEGSEEAEDIALPEEEPDSCHRKRYKELSKKYGPYAFIDLHDRNFRDYRMGRESNYEVGCPRIFLNMHHVEGTTGLKRWEGSLTVGYEAEDDSGRRGILLQSYDTGEGAAENVNNYWIGKSGIGSNPQWPAGETKWAGAFVAIFEDDTAALIIRINKVIRVDVGDGHFRDKGEGEVWFKMFRGYAGKNDPCYTKGGYISQMRIQPPRPNKPCWQLKDGPFNCLPEGRQTHKAFAQKGLSRDYKCYKKLGKFAYLDIPSAFNLEGDNVVPQGERADEDE